MLHWSFLFFVISMVCAVFGYARLADGAAAVAQILFVVFAAALALSLLAVAAQRWLPAELWQRGPFRGLSPRRPRPPQQRH